MLRQAAVDRVYSSLLHDPVDNATRSRTPKFASTPNFLMGWFLTGEVDGQNRHNGAVYFDLRTARDTKRRSGTTPSRQPFVSIEELSRPLATPLPG
jgi:hypothetical protein